MTPHESADALARVWRKARSHLERRGAIAWALGDLGTIRFSDLNDRELFALATFLGAQSPLPSAAAATGLLRRGNVVQLALADLDVGIRLSGVAPSLVALLEARGGVLRDIPSEHADVSGWLDAVWRSPHTPNLMQRRWFGSWIDSLSSDGLVTRICAGREDEVISLVLRTIGEERQPTRLSDLIGRGYSSSSPRILPAFLWLYLSALAGEFGCPRPIDERGSLLLLHQAGMDCQQDHNPMMLGDVTQFGPFASPSGDGDGVVFVTTSVFVAAAAAFASAAVSSPLVLANRNDPDGAALVIRSAVAAGRTVKLRSDFSARGIEFVSAAIDAVGAHAAGSVSTWRFGEEDLRRAVDRWRPIVTASRDDQSVETGGDQGRLGLADTVAAHARLGCDVPEYLSMADLLFDLQG